MKRNKLLYYVLFFFIVTVCITCGKKEKVKVAIMTKLQAGSIVGSSEVNAAKLFLEDHKIDDIEIFPIDDAWEPEKAKSAYEEVKKRGINILITSHISTCAVAISDAINKDRALTFVTGATTDALSKKDDYILRNIQDVESEQKSIAEYISKMPQKKLLIVRDMDNYSYTTPALKYFQSAISKEKVTSFDISISKLDLNAVEQEFRKQEFDILYLLIGGYKSTSGSIAQLAKKINREVKIIFTPWMKTPTILETAGSAIKNSVMPSHYPPRAESPVVNNYIERFKNKFGYAPTFISLNVYSALQIITQAVRAGNRLPDDIKTYVLKTRKFDTEFGTVEFDQYGDTQKPLYFITDLTVEF